MERIAASFAGGYGRTMSPLPSSRGPSAWSDSTRRVGVAVVTTLVLWPGQALAEMDEWAFTVGAGVTGVGADPLAIAPTLSLALRYGVDDFLIVGATLDGGPRFSDGLDGAYTLASTELVYALDIVSWVPRLSLGLGALATLADESRVDLALTAGLGLEYRAERDWALLFTGRYIFLPTASDQTSAFSASFGFTFYFE